jgi:hypothetical protein
MRFFKLVFIQKNRFVILFLLSVVILPFLSGCGSELVGGNSPTPPPAGTSKGSEVPATSPPAENPPAIFCGNGKIDSGEWCDGTEILPNLFGNPMSCSDAILYKTGKLTRAIGTLNCSSDCDLDISQCVTSYCGNGKLDPGEECDTGNPSVHQKCSDDCRVQCASDEVPGIFKALRDGKETFEKHCYFDNHHFKRNYPGAESACRNFGGHLLILDSQEEYDHVIEKVIKNSRDEKRWIGLRRDPNPNENPYWFENFYWIPYSWGIEIKKEFGKQLAWQGKKGGASVIPYEFLGPLWNNGEPSYCNNWFCSSTEPVVEILWVDGQYKLNDSTEDSTNSFICEIEPAMLYAE